MPIAVPPPLLCRACDELILHDDYHEDATHGYAWHPLCCPECNPELPLEESRAC
jgi:hydrogenase maturation factor HypF (carbamoyltransferase family)